jgi:hypothetical protein
MDITKEVKNYKGRNLSKLFSSSILAKRHPSAKRTTFPGLDIWRAGGNRGRLGRVVGVYCLLSIQSASKVGMELSDGGLRHLVCGGHRDFCFLRRRIQRRIQHTASIGGCYPAGADASQFYWINTILLTL